jgi:hypothetical protein
VTIFAVLMLVLTATLWIAVMATASTINDSDAAGNGLSYSFGILMAIALWVLLGGLLILAGVRGVMPAVGQLAAFVLLPASGAAAVAAFGLLKDRAAPGNWPLAILVLVPALIIGYALWTALPAIRALVPAGLATSVTWGGILALSIAPWPLVSARSRAGAEQRARVEANWKVEEAKQREAEQQENRQKFERLNADSPLWEWMLFTVGDNQFREQALQGARRSPRRQADAEEMLANGHDFPLRELPRLDLQATPKFCELSRTLLQKHAEDWRTTVPEPPQYAVRAASIERYFPAMEWLLQHRCDLSQPIASLMQTVRGYPQAADRDRFLAALAGLAPPR